MERKGGVFYIESVDCFVNIVLLFNLLSILIICLSKYIEYAVVGYCFGATGWLAWREKVAFFILGVLFVL